MEKKDQIIPSETSNALPKADHSSIAVLPPHMMEAAERLLSVHEGGERRLKRKASDMISGSPPVAPSGRRGRKPVASHGVRESGEGSRRGGRGRGRGRGRGSRGGRSSTTGGGVVQSGKKEEEYVCFVCLDGGDLVVCDQRKCPKVYHPDCIDRDESYLQSKGDWYCGWHMCNKCGKSAPHKCYTCVFSLCKECLNQAEFVRVRGDKGFCTTCMNMVMAIESADVTKKSDGIDFYFKDYYLGLKEKLFLTFEELAKANGSESSYGRNNSNAVHEPSSDRSSGKNEPSPQKNLDDYAAIDMQNISLMYLRRNMLEDLLDNIGTFNDKVIGSFVRIRVSGDVYRLVQVVGTCKSAENYKIGEKETDVLLEILNLNEKEFLSVNFVSKQEFSEEECKQLRQSIKHGIVGRLKLGDVQEKAGILKAVRVNDRIRREKLRLGNLRDHAIEQGYAEQLRECLEKLEVLNTPQELMRRLNKVPEIHADPKMDPNYGSSDDEGKMEHERQGNCDHSRDCIPTNNQDKSTYPAACTDIIPYLNQGMDELQENRLVPQSAHANEESLKDAGHQENTETAVSAEMIPSTFVSCKSSLSQGKKEQKNNSLEIEDTSVIASCMTYTRENRNLALREPFFAESGREATYIGKRNSVPSNTLCSAQKSIQTAWENKNKETAAFTEISPSTCVSYGKYGSFLSQGTKEQQANSLAYQSAFALVNCRSPLNQERKEHQENCLAIEESLKGGVSNTNQLANISESRIVASHRTTMTEKHTEPDVSADLNPSAFVSCPSSLDQEKKEQKGNNLVIEENLKNDASNIRKLAVNSETMIIAAQKSNETEKLWHYQDPTGKVQGPFRMIQLQKWNKTGLFPATLRIWKVSDRQEESILLIDALNGKFLL